MSNVVELKLVEVGENFRFEADKLLDAAKGQQFAKLAIIGENPDGTLWLSGTSNAGETLILLKWAEGLIVTGKDPRTAT